LISQQKPGHTDLLYLLEASEKEADDLAVKVVEKHDFTCITKS